MSVLLNGIKILSRTLISAVGSVVTTTDAFFNRVSLLLNDTGVNTATNNTFVDSSSSPATLTKAGSPRQGTFTPYSQTGWSNYFTGAEVISVPASSAYAMGTGDFTIEAWVNPANPGAYQGIFSSFNSAGSVVGVSLSVRNTGLVEFIIGSGVGGVNLITSSAALTADTWTHLAAVRNGADMTLYVNGVQASTAGISVGAITYAAGAVIGKYYVNGTDTNLYSGYISNLRIVKGTAIYTGAFTPSTVPLTAVAGTTLLTAQSNRFIDNSTSALAFTFTGSPATRAFSPFNPTTAYSTAAVGGSMLLNGSTEMLSFTSSSLGAIGTDAFTVEGWIYPTAYNYYSILSSNPSTNSGTGILLGFSNTGIPNFLIGNGGGGATSSIVGTTAVPLNTWTHVAATKTAGSGGTMTLWINGVSVATGTTTLSPAIADFVVGRYYNNVNNYYFPGYLSDVRAVIGTAIYTGTFTPPTAPLTAVSGTALLLKATNSGIFDSAAKNDLTTVGTSQVSTAQAKFGSSSVYFDGSSSVQMPLDSSTTAFGAGDFTVETWVYPTAVGVSKAIFAGQGNYASAAGSSMIFYISNTGAMSDVYVGAGAAAVASPNAPINQWSHIAMVRNGSTLTTYLNGDVVASVSITGTMNLGTSYGPSIGAFATGPSGFTGYMDDFRITKGLARYTAAFTPPTEAFPTY